LCLLRAISVSGARPDSFRIGKIADILPTRLRVIIGYATAQAGTRRPIVRASDWGAPGAKQLLSPSVRQSSLL